jgi:hypothetical protein
MVEDGRQRVYLVALETFDESLAQLYETLEHAARWAKLVVLTDAEKAATDEEKPRQSNDQVSLWGVSAMPVRVNA